MCKADHMSRVESDEVLPYTNVGEPLKNDVLLGRGGGTNHHYGNKVYRQKVEDAKVEYLGCTRLEKPLVALRIVKEIRQARGRFLKFDKKAGLWNDVGDKKAREKTSQALREQAPEIRKTMDVSPSRRQKWDTEDEFGQHIEEESGNASRLFESVEKTNDIFFDDGNADFVAPADLEDTPASLDSFLSSDILDFATQGHTSSWSQRDHSLALNPLPHATIKDNWAHDSVPSKHKSKRATSHQNETAETKRGYKDGQATVKRASVNIEDRMSSLDLACLGDDIVPQGESERLSSVDLLDLVTPVEEV